jgi:glutamate--cysteine ligase
VAGTPMTIGAELELIPFDVATRRVVPISAGSGKCSLAVVRTVAQRRAWVEASADGDPPSWSLPGGGRISFEPGGQIELSSARCETASVLIRDLQCTSQLLGSAFEREGISLEASGVDPYNDISDVSLQLHRSRYERMTRYFDAIGASGSKMMRQTASLQINVQAGARPYERWALLNALAPYLTAIFANSPAYAGVATGHRSYRAHLWRTLDSTRTGLPVDIDDPSGAYFDFALRAGAMMYTGDLPYPSFGEWLNTGEPTREDWELHLTTLFPEVRPRGYFELRSVDAIPPAYLAAPISFVAGLVYDDAAAHAAAELLDPRDSGALRVAGRSGLGDSAIRATALRLTDLALAGCESLGRTYISSGDIRAAADFFDRYTRQGRAPGDDWS